MAQLIAFEDTELDNIVKQEEEAFSSLQWSQETLPLPTFISKFTLPQIVRIEDGYYSQEEDSSLSSGQILKIHCLKTSKKVLGADQHGDDVYIPLNATEKVMLRPDNWGKTYETVNDLFHAKPLPKFVEVTRGYYDPTGNVAEHDYTIEPGEKLEVLGEVDPSHFPRAMKQRHMKFKNRKNMELTLPFDSAPQFIPLLDMKQMLIAEAVHGRKLPLYVSFALTNENAAYTQKAVYTQKGASDKNLSRFGVIKLKEMYEEELIVASCGHHNVRVIFTIPKCIDVTVKVAVGTFNNDPTYVGLCHDYNNYKKIETLAIQRHEKDIYRTSKEVRGYEYYLKSKEGGEFEGMGDDDNGDDDYFQVNDSDSENEYVCSEEFARSPGVDSMKSRGTLPYEIASINIADFKEGGKYSKHVSIESEKRDNTTGSYDFRAAIKGNSADNKESVTLLGMKKYTSREEIHTNPEIREPVSSKAQELQDSNEYLVAVNIKKQVEESQKPSMKAETVPVTRADSREDADFVIPSKLENLSTEEVLKCLRKLNLSQFERVFRDNQINGELLVSLELDDYKDLNMTNFQAKKIMKFVAGWRPDV